jgi:radical SAM superfamily enzyme with C-terminal helix-hairpin-helix motif
LGGRGRQISEFEASLVYRVNSRTVRAAKTNPVSKTKKKKKKKKKNLNERYLKWLRST